MAKEQTVMSEVEKAALDAVGKIAQEFVNLVESRSSLQDQINEKEQELITALEKSGRTNISIAGKVLKLNHREAKDKIKIVKQDERK